MTNEVCKRFIDVLEACQAVMSFVAEKDFADYESDHMLRSAVERQFEIIGEAMSKACAADPAIAAEIPDFHRIVGLRNRLIHGYDNVDEEILWDAVQSKIEPLQAQIAAALRESE